MSKRKLNDICRQYHISFIELTKCLVSDCITFDEYKEMLHDLMLNYRKEKLENGYA